jgi:superfamily II DNA or RNA helicase
VIFSQPLGPETSSRQLIDSIKTLLSQENIEKISRWVNTENTVEQVIGQIDKNIPALRARLHEQPRPGKPPLRPYQEEAITKYVEKVITGQTKCYIQMATGCGKTLVFVHLVKLLDLDKNLIVAPTKTIANQIIQELLFSDLYDEGAVGLFDSDDVHTFDSKVKIVVTTYQSVLSQWRLPPAKRKLNFQEAKLIILDEAHHALSKMVSEIVVDCSLHSLVLGATATPAYDTLRDRLSLSELEELLGPNSCVFSYDISKAIDDKILCPVTVKYLNFKERLSVRQARPTGLKKNDLSEGTLQKRINTEFYNNTIAEFLGNGTIVITSLAGTQTVVPLVKKKIVIFCPGIENAKALANTTNAKLKDNPYYLEQLKLSEKFMMAAAISGDMDSGEQKNIIGRFKEGKIQFLFGCDILIEGFNEPSVEVILNLRPTYSGLLEKQRCGRGLRLREDKTLIIIECTWPNIRRNQVYFSQFIQDQQQYGTDDTFAIFPNIDTGTPQELPFAITDIPSGALIKRKPVKKQPESIPSPLPELPTLFPIKHTIDISGEEEPQRKKHKFTTEGATPMEVQEPIPVLAVPAEYPADIGIFESFILACKNNPKGARQIMEYLMGLGNNLTILLLQACSYEYEHSKEAIQMLMDVGANSVEALLLLCRTNMGRPDENIAITNYTTLNNLIDQIPASNMENAFRVICCDEESVSDQVNKAILVMMIKNKITKDLLRSVFDEACNNNDLATIKNLIEYSRMVRFDQYMEKYYQQLKAKQPDSLSSPYPPAEKQLDVFFELDDALLIACEHGYFQMAKLLLEYNPDPHISHEGTLKIIESLVPANKEERKAKETVQDLLEGKYALGSTPSLSP